MKNLKIEIQQELYTIRKKLIISSICFLANVTTIAFFWFFVFLKMRL